MLGFASDIQIRVRVNVLSECALNCVNGSNLKDNLLHTQEVKAAFNVEVTEVGESDILISFCQPSKQRFMLIFAKNISFKRYKQNNF